MIEQIVVILSRCKRCKRRNICLLGLGLQSSVFVDSLDTTDLKNIPNTSTFIGREMRNETGSPSEALSTFALDILLSWMILGDG